MKHKKIVVDGRLMWKYSDICLGQMLHGVGATPQNAKKQWEVQADCYRVTVNQLKNS